MDRVADCGSVDPSSNLGGCTDGGVPEWPNGMVSKTISVYPIHKFKSCPHRFSFFIRFFMIQSGRNGSG